MHQTEDDDTRPRCAKCLGMIEHEDFSIIVSAPNGIPHFYHVECFVKASGVFLQRYERFKKQQKQNQSVLSWNHHLCEECFRILDISKEPFIMHTENGATKYRHQKCPTLKEKWVPPKT